MPSVSCWWLLTCVALPSIIATHAAVDGISPPSPPPVHDIRVEYVSCPVYGVQVERPRFSWSLKHSQRGATQNNYRVVVTAAGNGGARLSGGNPMTRASNVVWDSGVVHSTQTIGVQCGASLKSDTTYSVSVTWTDHNNATSTPAVGTFTTALMTQVRPAARK